MDKGIGMDNGIGMVDRHGHEHEEGGGDVHRPVEYAFNKWWSSSRVRLLQMDALCSSVARSTLGSMRVLHT